jgi:hypothetical protein
MITVNIQSQNQFSTYKSGKDFFVNFLLDYSKFNPTDDLVFSCDLSSIMERDFNPIQTMILSWNGLAGTVLIEADNLFKSNLVFWNAFRYIDTGGVHPFIPQSGISIQPFYCTMNSEITFKLNQTPHKFQPSNGPIVYNTGQMLVTFTSKKIKSFQNYTQQIEVLQDVFPISNPLSPIIAEAISINSVPAGQGVKLNNVPVSGSVQINGVPI